MRNTVHVSLQCDKRPLMWNMPPLCETNGPWEAYCACYCTSPNITAWAMPSPTPQSKWHTLTWMVYGSRWPELSSSTTTNRGGVRGYSVVTHTMLCIRAGYDGQRRKNKNNKNRKQTKHHNKFKTTGGKEIAHAVSTGRQHAYVWVMVKSNEGPIYMTTLLGENEGISLCFSLSFTPKRLKWQAKQRLLKTKTKV